METKRSYINNAARTKTYSVKRYADYRGQDARDATTNESVMIGYFLLLYGAEKPIQVHVIANEVDRLEGHHAEEVECIALPESPQPL